MKRIALYGAILLVGGGILYSLRRWGEDAQFALIILACVGIAFLSLSPRIRVIVLAAVVASAAVVAGFVVLTASPDDQKGTDQASPPISTQKIVQAKRNAQPEQITKSSEVLGPPAPTKAAIQAMGEKAQRAAFKAERNEVRKAKARAERKARAKARAEKRRKERAAARKRERARARAQARARRQRPAPTAPQRPAPAPRATPAPRPAPAPSPTYRPAPAPAQPQPKPRRTPKPKLPKLDPNG